MPHGYGVTHNHLPTLKRLVGTVIGTSMDRTAVVAVHRLQQHPRTRKYMRVTTRIFAHDHHEVCGVGDRVELKKCAPQSRKKYFAVVDILHRHPQLDGEPFPFSRLRRPELARAHPPPAATEEREGGGGGGGGEGGEGRAPAGAGEPRGAGGGEGADGAADEGERVVQLR